MSRLEMPFGDGALAVAYEKAAPPCSTRRCRKSCPTKGTDRDWRVSSGCDSLIVHLFSKARHGTPVFEIFDPSIA